MTSSCSILSSQSVFNRLDLCFRPQLHLSPGCCYVPCSSTGSLSDPLSMYCGLKRLNRNKTWLVILFTVSLTDSILPTMMHFEEGFPNCFTKSCFTYWAPISLTGNEQSNKLSVAGELEPSCGVWEHCTDDPCLHFGSCSWY